MGAFQTEYKLLRRVWYPKIYIIQALENSAQLGEKKRYYNYQQNIEHLRESHNRSTSTPDTHSTPGTHPPPDTHPHYRYPPTPETHPHQIPTHT